jgi:hypothetical protein
MKFNLKRVNKIQTAKNHIESAFSMFTKAAKGIDIANGLLEEVKNVRLSEKDNLKNRITDIDAEINSVENDMATNNELKKKLQMFLP